MDREQQDSLQGGGGGGTGCSSRPVTGVCVGPAAGHLDTPTAIPVTHFHSPTPCSCPPAGVHSPTAAQQVEKVTKLDSEGACPFVGESLRILRREVGDQAAVLGFVGAPFTLATYIIEGGSSKNFAHTKRMAFGNPAVLHALLDKLADNVADYVRYQVGGWWCRLWVGGWVGESGRGCVGVWWRGGGGGMGVKCGCCKRRWVGAGCIQQSTAATYRHVHLQVFVGRQGGVSSPQCTTSCVPASACVWLHSAGGGDGAQYP
jgi:hypothetical protein